MKSTNLVKVMTIFLLYFFLTTIVSAESWEFNVPGDTDGWIAYNAGTVNENTNVQIDGIFVIDPVGPDPRIEIHGISLDVSAANSLNFSMSSNCPDNIGAIYFETAESPGFSEDKKVDFTVTTGSEWHEYSIPMSGNAFWKGTVTGLRIDPADNGNPSSDDPNDTFGFDYIRAISSSSDNPTTAANIFSPDSNLNVKITNVDATKLQNYFIFKSKQTMNPIAAPIVAAGNEHAINSIFIMALAAWEGGWGTSQYSTTRHNWFGYGAYYSDPDNAWEFNSDAEGVDVVARRIKADYLLNSGKYSVLIPTGTINNHPAYPYILQSVDAGTHYNGPTVRGWIVKWNIDSQSEMNGIVSIMNDFASWHLQTYGEEIIIDDVPVVSIPTPEPTPIAYSTYSLEMPVKNMKMEYEGCPTAYPINFKYSTVWTGDYYSGCEGTGTHAGVDIPLKESTPIYAIADGSVFEIQRTGTKGTKDFGAHIVLKHDIPGIGIFYSVYGHFKSGSIPSGIESEGVKKGDLIGKSGNTGYVLGDGGGYHLHFQIEKNIAGSHPYLSLPDIKSIKEKTYNPIIFINENQKSRIIPLSGNLYGSENKNDIAGTFNSSTSEFKFGSKTVQFGLNTDMPVIGDWDGDGDDNIGVFRPIDDDGVSRFYLITRDWNDLPYKAGDADKRIYFGPYPTNIPIAGDWDGDEKDDIGGFSPEKNVFYLYKLDLDESSANSYQDIPFGETGDIPFIGDWDKDGKDEIGVFRHPYPDNPETNAFYFDRDLTGVQHDFGVIGPDGKLQPYAYGKVGDYPLIGDWDGDGDDNIGVYRPLNQQFYNDSTIPSITATTTTTNTNDNVNDENTNLGVIINIIEKYGSKDEELKYDSNVDLNKDGIINVHDFTEYFKNIINMLFE